MEGSMWTVRELRMTTSVFMVSRCLREHEYRNWRAANNAALRDWFSNGEHGEQPFVPDLEKDPDLEKEPDLENEHEHGEQQVSQEPGVEKEQKQEQEHAPQASQPDLKHEQEHASQLDLLQEHEHKQEHASQLDLKQEQKQQASQHADLEHETHRIAEHARSAARFAHDYFDLRKPVNLMDYIADSPRRPPAPPQHRPAPPPPPHIRGQTWQWLQQAPPRVGAPGHGSKRTKRRNLARLRKKWKESVEFDSQVAWDRLLYYSGSPSDDPE